MSKVLKTQKPLILLTKIDVCLKNTGVRAHTAFQPQASVLHFLTRRAKDAHTSGVTAAGFPVCPDVFNLKIILIISTFFVKYLDILDAICL